jgi:hypothetical protein
VIKVKSKKKQTLGQMYVIIPLSISLLVTGSSLSGIASLAIDDTPGWKHFLTDCPGGIFAGTKSLTILLTSGELDVR